MPALPTSWLARAALLALLVTALRIAALAFSQADLFVDEAQYWLWGQNLDFGYYSKPPLIAWVIRAVTGLAGSDSAFWVRLPAPVFHGATALILGAWAASVLDGRSALWVVAGYLTMPIVAVGSAMISTDTIMAPFLAGGLYAYWRLLATRRAGLAVLTGALIGLAFMAKYAAVYFFVGAALSAAFCPATRPGWRNLALLLLAFGLVILPNLAWNLSHDLTTVDHTMDNVGWIKGEAGGVRLNFGSLAAFLGSQFAAAGPVLFVALLLSLSSADVRIRRLLAFALPVLAIVSVQALLAKAYGNWAFAAYLPGVIAATAWLAARSAVWLRASLALNALVAIALPLVTVFGTGLAWQGRPLLERYLGRDELSRQILALAEQSGALAIVASDRDVLADLFLTGKGAGIEIRAVPPQGRPKSYYEQVYALDPATGGPVLYISTRRQVSCDRPGLTPLAPLDLAGGYMAGRTVRAFLVGPDCLGALR